MKLIRKSDGVTYTPKGHDASVFSRSLCKDEGADIHVTTFPALAGMREETHPEHAHLFYVLDGEMTVLQAGRQFARLTAGDAVQIPAGEPHEIRNDAEATMTFLAVTYPQHPAD